MKTRLLSGIAIVFLLFGVAGVSQAALETIGHGYHYDGTKVVKSALIWDKDIDANGNSLVWLDYSNDSNIWQGQHDWAGGLDAQMWVELLPDYSVIWDDSQWRLPDAHNQDGTGPDFGYNITGSEMGHLFYEELGLSGDSVTNAQLNASEFNNLRSTMYWSGTEYADVTGNAWFFKMNDGFQHYYKSNYVYGLAVRSGQVSAVPVPGAIWLLGSGLLATVGIRRKGHH